MSNLVFEKSKLQARQYQITVYGKLDPSWAEWFGGLTLTVKKDRHGISTTRLTGSLPDQSALRGILNKLWDLNIVLLSVKCIDHPSWRKKWNTQRKSLRNLATPWKCTGL